MAREDDLAQMVNGYLTMADVALAGPDISKAKAWSEDAKATALADCTLYHDTHAAGIQAWLGPEATAQEIEDGAVPGRMFTMERVGMEFWKVRQGKSSFPGDGATDAMRDSAGWTKPLPAVDAEGEKFFR